ncbi:MAG TPA: GYD domain-containing protein [Candidatus Acidoferrales bacterium]|nr:GYD domain-containing protein [Candidatus Acidoferrales bacterium]
MPHYLIQVAYKDQAWQALIKNPVDRIEAVRPAVENLGGKLQEGWFAFGDYDIVCIAEMPDNVAAAAIAIAFAGGGACKSVKTTPLMSTAEAVEALKKASRAGYRAATA